MDWNASSGQMIDRLASPQITMSYDQIRANMALFIPF